MVIEAGTGDVLEGCVEALPPTRGQRLELGGRTYEVVDRRWTYGRSRIEPVGFYCRVYVTARPSAPSSLRPARERA
jgi:hypothetical protein